MPETSPLTSAVNTATPAAESCSAISWSVRVLPVPVAPAIRPCRFIVASGRRTAASGTSAPPSIPVPSSTAPPFVAYAAAIAGPNVAASGRRPRHGARSYQRHVADPVRGYYWIQNRGNRAFDGVKMGILGSNLSQDLHTIEPGR